MWRCYLAVLLLLPRNRHFLNHAQCDLAMWLACWTARQKPRALSPYLISTKQIATLAGLDPDRALSTLCGSDAVFNGTRACLPSPARRVRKRHGPTIG